MPSVVPPGYGRDVTAEDVAGPARAAGSWARLRRLDAEHPWLLDLSLAVALFVASAGAALVPGPAARPADATLFVLLAAGAAPYGLRRRAPLAVLLLASIPVLAIIALGYSSAVIGSGLFLAAYTVAAWCTTRTTAVAGIYVAVLLGAVVAVRPRSMTLAEMATNAALFVGAFTLGRSAQTRRDNAALLLERAALAERARSEEALRAVSEERLRIARELHDVVGHSLGVIAVRAGVGAHVIDTDPAEARAALLTISQTSREALGEVRRILGALRTEEDLTYAPAPSLAHLEDLAADLRLAGLPVTVTVSGEPSNLPAGLDLTAYRLVQAALTNVLRHAGPARAEVRIAYEPRAVALEVLDDGRGLPRTGSAGGQAGEPGRGSPAGGHGLLGMQERVAVWGGVIEVGNRPEGGFRVAVRLPVPQDGVR